MIGLPTPLVTAHIDERGNVTITSDPESDDAAPRREVRAPGHCSTCGLRGHASTNRKFHPRTP